MTHDRVDVSDGRQSAAIVTRTVELTGGSPEAKREEIRAYFHETFSLYEGIFECLADDDAFYFRANRLRHPLIFYFGHTATFFVNKLITARCISERLDPHLESILAIGVDEMSWDDLDETHYDWPSVDEVRAYRARVRRLVDDFISQCDVSLPIGWSDPLWIIMMGIEHERIHLETTSVLIRELPLQRVRGHELWGRVCTEHGEPEPNALLPVRGGRVVLGRPRDGGDKRAVLYGWDNEYGRLSVDVPDFKASQALVSNREFKAFVDDGGYQTRRHWTDEGWRWVQYREAKRPVFWVERGGRLYLRNMLQETPLPWNWPVEVNCLEAQAFCAWKSEREGRSIRLPSESEWYRLRALCPQDQPDWPHAPGNINLEGEMSACPVNRHRFADGFYDIIGNVWQWTQTPIYAFEGFQVHPAYDDFSVPTFDGRHNLFKGGCWVSTGNYALRDSRYAFRRHFFQHAGFRYVEAGPLPEPEASLSKSGGAVPDGAFVTDSAERLAQMDEFHYGASYFDIPNFPLACARLALSLSAGGPQGRALDLGCGSGRAAFELATAFEHVDALDVSARLLQGPVALQRDGRHTYILRDEGELSHTRQLSLKDLGYEAVKDRVSFMQSDACNLHGKFSGYDLVLAADLIEHLYDPAAFLREIKTRLKPHGLLILTSTYSWDAATTPRSHWLGGFVDAQGEALSSLQAIGRVLAPELQQQGEALELPWALRITERTFHSGISQVTVWRRTS